MKSKSLTNVSKEVIETLKETEKHLIEHGMIICPYNGIQIELDKNDNYRVNISLVLLDTVPLKTRDELINSLGEVEECHLCK